MSCPYPTAAEAARVLRCGYDPSTCAGPVRQTHVVTLGADQGARPGMDALAQAGGGEAFHTATPAELRGALDAALSSILRDAAR